MLAAEQKTHFDVFGFLVIRQLFSPEEVSVITREFEAALLEEDWFLGRAPVEFLANDERVHGPIQRLLGPGYESRKGNDGNFYVGDTGWHADMGWDPHIPGGRNDPNRIDGQWRDHYVPSIKVAFYLDPVEGYGLSEGDPGLAPEPVPRTFLVTSHERPEDRIGIRECASQAARDVGAGDRRSRKRRAVPIGPGHEPLRNGAARHTELPYRIGAGRCRLLQSPDVALVFRRKGGPADVHPELPVRADRRRRERIGIGIAL